MEKLKGCGVALLDTPGGGSCRWCWAGTHAQGTQPCPVPSFTALGEKLTGAPWGAGQVEMQRGWVCTFDRMSLKSCEINTQERPGTDGSLEMPHGERVLSQRPWGLSP